jgi:hypothetical protein
MNGHVQPGNFMGRGALWFAGRALSPPDGLGSLS